MTKWQRSLYTPVLPMGTEETRITGCTDHIALSRRAAAEGMVLLKNEQDLLPLRGGCRVALFGKGTVDYVKGGGGSGDVTVAYTRSLYDGMIEKEAEGYLSLLHDLPAYYEEEIAKQYAQGAQPGMTVEPELPEALLKKAKSYADVAIISICRFSGEGWDRKTEDISDLSLLASWERDVIERSNAVFDQGDFYLTKAEAKMVEQVTNAFDKVIVVMNVGGMVDTSWFKDNPAIASVLMAWQGGMEGGCAACDILCGDVNPSGKLVDTFARRLEDYPSTYNFHEALDRVEYTEDIYVGYRYFETIPGAMNKVNYPFGYGLSYTTFAWAQVEGYAEGEAIKIRVKLTNTGAYAGKEVVQVYVEAPQGKLGHARRVLAAYKKTKLLAPGESQTILLTIWPDHLASYDDKGLVQKSAYVMEAGNYYFYVGNSVRSAEKIAYAHVEANDRLVVQYSEKAAPTRLSKRLRADGNWEEVTTNDGRENTSAADDRKQNASAANDRNQNASAASDTNLLSPQNPADLEGIKPAIRGWDRSPRHQDETNGKLQLVDVWEGKCNLDAFIKQMSDDDLIHLLGGQPNTGVANTYGIGNMPEYGIPNIMTADGPAGLRIQPECGVTTTAWPCATQLACTWDPELIYEIGRAGAMEVKENNISVWLTPAMNIHRSPLCGRNFEYYSEDPLVAGMCGAAMVQGIQSQHVGASVKHFCCNNKETNRKRSDSCLSERALREIYLKGFEIVVELAKPYTIMSSYNLINGVQASENKDLLTGILREEWGYEGMVTTDWWTFGEHYKETKAGNDLKMATGYPERVMVALDKGLISREEIEVCVKRILQMILKID